MKIYIHYNITDKPWGGGNSFLKAFKRYCEVNHIELAKSANENYDILFFNACSRSQNKLISVDELINLKVYGYVNRFLGKFLKPKKKLLVYRSDGFRDEYAGMGCNIGDEIQRLCLHLADHVVFQNENCLRTAMKQGNSYQKHNYSIVYNGVDQELFQMKTEGFWDGKRPLRIFSANWSSNPNKGYAIIAAFSKLEGVECFFCGNWPHDIDKKRVTVFPPQTQDKLAKEYKKYDVFLHPSEFDQSPNVCLEALSCGLPFIYHPTSGIREVAGDCGIPIDEESLHQTLLNISKKYFFLVEKIMSKRDYYSMDRCAREYINIFHGVLKSKSS